MVDQFGNAQVNYGSDIIVLVNYTGNGCFGPFGIQAFITIPYGSSEGFYEYYSSQYVDCGFSGCQQETLTPDCVDFVSQYSVDIASPIPAC